jgi:hypothetical protein
MNGPEFGTTVGARTGARTGWSAAAAKSCQELYRLIARTSTLRLRDAARRFGRPALPDPPRSMPAAVARDVLEQMLLLPTSTEVAALLHQTHRLRELASMPDPRQTHSCCALTGVWFGGGGGPISTVGLVPSCSMTQ